MATSFGQARDYAASTAPLPFAIPKRATIQEIVPRDGLQLEPGVISTSDNIAIVDALSATGVPRVQLTTFVRPDAVPRLSDAAEVMADCTHACEVQNNGMSKRGE